MHAKEYKLPIIDFDLGAKILGDNNTQAAKEHGSSAGKDVTFRFK